jgi:hypothetical protein
MGETRNAYKICTRKLRGRSYVEQLDVGGRIILKLISRKRYLKVWTAGENDR